MKVDVLLGLQWGDEGKGKIVDVITPKYDIIARFQGGPNAGHTLEFDGTKVVLNTIPSGIFRPHAMNIIGNGVVIDPWALLEEIATAAKLIGREVNKAGLAETMGLTGRTNVHGEQVQALDEFSNWTVI